MTGKNIETLIGGNIPSVVSVSMKGGSGKTSTLLSLASYLNMVHGRDVVFIDLDSTGYGYHALTGEKPQNLSPLNRRRFIDDFIGETKRSVFPQNIAQNINTFYQDSTNKVEEQIKSGIADIRIKLGKRFPSEPMDWLDPFPDIRDDVFNRLESLVGKLDSYMIAVRKLKGRSGRIQYGEDIRREFAAFYDIIEKYKNELLEMAPQGGKGKHAAIALRKISQSLEIRLPEFYLNKLFHPHEKAVEIPYYFGASLDAVHLPIQLFFKDRYYIGDEKYQQLITKMKRVANQGKILLFDTPHFGSSDFFFQPIIELGDTISRLTVLSVTRDVPAEIKDSHHCYEDAREILQPTFGARLHPSYVCNSSIAMNPFLLEQAEHIRENFPEGIEAYRPGSDAIGLAFHGVRGMNFSAEELVHLLPLYNPIDMGRLDSERYDLEYTCSSAKSSGIKREILKSNKKLKSSETRRFSTYREFISLPYLGQDSSMSSPGSLLPLKDVYDQPVVLPNVLNKGTYSRMGNLDLSLNWQMLAKHHYYQSIGKIADMVLGLG